MALEGRVLEMSLELRDRRVIALGERDGVSGEGISTVASASGARVVMSTTECFV